MTDIVIRELKFKDGAFVIPCEFKLVFKICFLLFYDGLQMKGKIYFIGHTLTRRCIDGFLLFAALVSIFVVY